MRNLLGDLAQPAGQAAIAPLAKLGGNPEEGLGEQGPRVGDRGHGCS